MLLIRLVPAGEYKSLGSAKLLPPVVHVKSETLYVVAPIMTGQIRPRRLIFHKPSTPRTGRVWDDNEIGQARGCEIENKWIGMYAVTSEWSKPLFGAT
jgi:hypothetical protein